MSQPLVSDRPRSAEGQTEALLQELGAAVEARTGLHFPQERRGDLARALREVSRELGFESAERCVAHLLKCRTADREFEALLGHLTNGETFFFRHMEAFDLLEQRLLPELIHARRHGGKRLRIWCAGCCTGEEPYSVAILLDRLIPDRRNWDISLLATDVNARFLQRAREGVYTEWSFRGAPLWVQRQCFDTLGRNRFAIRPYLKEMVTFARHNLAEDTPPTFPGSAQGVDLLFCRNVLIYFARDRARQVLGNLHSLLAEDGLLVVGPSDMLLLRETSFTSLDSGVSVLYRKTPLAPADCPLFPAGDVAGSAPKLSGCAEAQHLLGEAARKPAARRAEAPVAPDSQEMLLLARRCANEGAHDEALDLCRKAIAADATNPVAHYFQGTILMERGELAAAGICLRRALFLEQGFVMAHFTLGHIARAQGKPKAAGKHFVNALEWTLRYRPDDPLPEADGMTAGRLAEILAPLAEREEER